MMDIHEVNEILNQAKSIAKTAGLIELNERLDFLSSEFEMLQKEIEDLKKENSHLKLKIPSHEHDNDDIEEMIKKTGPPESCYEGEDSTTLFCPSCWENNKVLVKLFITPPQTTSIGKYRCPECNKPYGNR